MSLFGTYIQEACEAMDNEKIVVDENYSFANAIAEVSYLEGALVAESATFAMLTEGFVLEGVELPEALNEDIKEKAKAAGAAIAAKAEAALGKIVEFFTNFSNKIYATIMNKITELSKSGRVLKSEVEVFDFNAEALKKLTKKIDNTANMYATIIGGSSVPTAGKVDELEQIEKDVAGLEENFFNNKTFKKTFKVGDKIEIACGHAIEAAKREKAAADTQKADFTKIKAGAAKAKNQDAGDKAEDFKKYLADAVKVGRLSMVVHNKIKNRLYADVAALFKASGDAAKAADKKEKAEEKAAKKGDAVDILTA